MLTLMVKNDSVYVDLKMTKNVVITMSQGQLTMCYLAETKFPAWLR